MLGIGDSSSNRIGTARSEGLGRATQALRLSRLAVSALFALVLPSCGSDPSAPSAPSASAGGVPAPAISDGAHDGNPHFYFLPPMVPSPAFSGTADPDASPTVVICAWNEISAGGACDDIIASFSRAGGSGSEAITFDGKQYHVNWHTDRCLSGPCELDPDRAYRLRVLIGGTELGHADVQIGATGKELKNVSTNEFIPLVNGRTLPVQFRIEQGAVQMVAPGAAASVGPAGGAVTKNDGSVSLKFPAGAVAATTAITMEVVTDPLPGAGEWAPPVELGPDGSTFGAPVTIRMAYDASKLPEGVTPHALKLSMWVDDHWEEVPGSQVDLTDATVSGEISHFSTYGLAIWPNAVEGHPALGTVFVGQQMTVQGAVWVWVTQPGSHCWYERQWVSLFSSGYWTWVQVCPSYSTPMRYPVSGMRVSFASGNPSVATVGAPGFAIAGVGGAGVVTSPPITGVGIGSAIISAHAGNATAATIVTVVGSLSFDVFGSGPVSLRRFGFNQGTGMNVKIPGALPNALTVTFTHSNLAVAGSNSSLVIPAGATQSGLTIGAGTVAGRDTLVGTAPGFGPDTLVIETGTGRMFIENWPTALALGDSAAIRIRPMNPDSAIIDNAWFTTFTLETNGKLVFTRNNATITTIPVPDGSSSTPVFYVKAIGFGPATATITQPWYVTAQRSVSITPPALVDPQSVCGHAITGIAYDGTAYWVAEGHDGLMQCLSRFDATSGVLTDVQQIPLDHRGLHWVPTLGRLTSRTWGGPIFGIVPATGAMTHLASNPTASRPGDEQSQPAVDPDGVSYWIVNDGVAERRRLSDHQLLKEFTVATTNTRNVIAVSNDWVFTLNGASANAYSKASGRLAGTQPLPHAHPCDYFGFGVSLAADRLMYLSDCRHVEIVPITVTIEEPPDDPPFLAAGGKSNCALLFDGNVTCWGEPANGATNPLAGPFATIGGGFFHYCGIRPDQSLACWGFDSDLRITPPTTGTYDRISVAPEHNCALRTDNTPVCWGFLNDGRGSPPAGTYKSIGLGWFHGCGIRPDDTLTCWGRNDFGQSTAPAGAFKAVSGGANFTCGIRSDDTLHCWGALSTAPSGTFGQVASASSGSHACAIRSDLTVTCWGQNDFGQANAPPGQYLQVVTNNQQSCAVRNDRAVVCWGNSAQPPPILANPH